MIRSLNTATTGMKAQQQNMDVIAHNMANASTFGFKKGRAEFEDLLYQQVKEPGEATGLNAVSPTGVQIGLGVRTGAVQKEHTIGSSRHTDSDLDMQVEGRGFFRLINEEGNIVYTRDGAFKKNSKGEIVDKNGLHLHPKITIPKDAIGIGINPQGVVSVIRDNMSEEEIVGQVKLTNFINPAGLKSLGRNNFLPSGASGPPVEGKPGESHFGTVSQGFLEMSNVNIAEEMVNMITAQRTYEANSKVIQASDQMLQTVNTLR